VLILGRCTSGEGGALIVDGAGRVLAAEFPELAQQITVQLPDEKSRRVGQSIAAASLPSLPLPTGETAVKCDPKGSRRFPSAEIGVRGR